MVARWRMVTLLFLISLSVEIVCLSVRATLADEGDAEVLTQGPVHEAFAEVILLTPRPGIIIQREPPPPVEEIPPEEKPAGDNVVWIPGYWAWDDERQDFVWVSGVWRIPPPNRKWVPGYWARVEGGWQWISGFWASTKTAEIEYLPPVPESLEVGPSSPSPGCDYIWTVGYWRWRENRYVWVPGCWILACPDWVYVPPHYIWTCGGYIFVDAYYDYIPTSRGILFAPIYFRHPYHHRYRCRPTVCIDVEIIFIGLFCRPTYCHYYFGDYYDPFYTRWGIYPWFTRHHVHRWYSPFCEHHLWHNRQLQPNWLEGLKRDYDARRTHRELRPPHTYRALETAIRQKPEGDLNKLAFAKPLTTYTAGSRSAFRFERLNDEILKMIVEQGQQRRDLALQRARLESASVTSGVRLKPSKVTLPTLGIPEGSPLVVGPLQRKPPFHSGDGAPTPRTPSAGPEPSPPRLQRQSLKGQRTEPRLQPDIIPHTSNMTQNPVILPPCQPATPQLRPNPGNPHASIPPPPHRQDTGQNLPPFPQLPPMRLVPDRLITRQFP